MRFSLDKYKFAFFKDESGKDTVCARSTYAGKTVKGYAKCDPRDNYDVESGKALAAARCTAQMVKDAQAYEARMKAYLSDSIVEADNAEAHVADLLSKM